MNIEQRVLMTIRRNCLWEHQDQVTLAVSGGVDSMVMLHAIHRTIRSHKGQLNVVTFDHGLRDASKQEVLLVSTFASELNIPCEILKLNLISGANLQERARNQRRLILEGYSGVIATAHHASDQAETVLYRLLRGSGLDGLRGMTYRSGRWVKPLLDIYKPDLISYAEENQISWMEDPTNPSTTRGKIRSLWPSLEKVRPHPQKVLVRLGLSLSRDADLIGTLVDEQYTRMVQSGTLHSIQMRTQHEAIQIRLIQRWLWSFGVNPSHQQLLDLLVWNPSKNGQRFSIKGQQNVLSKDGLWYLCGG